MTLSAVLLAGGESRRMGTDKATIIFRGQRLWERQLEILRELDSKRIFISGRIDPSWRPPGIELLLDEPPSRGPLSGLTRALARTETTHLAALAIDMPFVRTEHIRFLFSLAAPGCGVVPMIDGRAEALCAIYPREASADFAAALAGTDFSLQSLIRILVRNGKVRTVDIPKAKYEIYRSVNEPGDLLPD